jgi:hypothetical protein
MAVGVVDSRESTQGRSAPGAFLHRRATAGLETDSISERRIGGIDQAM